MQERLSSESFANRVGERFALEPSEGEGFDVVLSACEETPYGDDELGELQLFLVPLGPEKAGMAYEAVIS